MDSTSTTSIRLSTTRRSAVCIIYRASFAMPRPSAFCRRTAPIAQWFRRRRARLCAGAWVPAGVVSCGDLRALSGAGGVARRAVPTAAGQDSAVAGERVDCAVWGGVVRSSSRHGGDRQLRNSARRPLLHAGVRGCALSFCAVFAAAARGDLSIAARFCAAVEAAGGCLPRVVAALCVSRWRSISTQSMRKPLPRRGVRCSWIRTRSGPTPISARPTGRCGNGTRRSAMNTRRCGCGPTSNWRRIIWLGMSRRARDR